MVALLLASCGGALEPDFTVGGLEFHVLTDELPWMREPPARERLAVMVDAVLHELGKEAEDVPRGSVVLVVPEGANVCGGYAACWNVQGGDWRHPEGKAWVVVLRSNGGIGPPVSCPERLGLMHELAHGLLPPGEGNWAHLDAQTWARVDGLWLRLLREALATRDDC